MYIGLWGALRKLKHEALTLKYLFKKTSMKCKFVNIQVIQIAFLMLYYENNYHWTLIRLLNILN